MALRQTEDTVHGMNLITNRLPLIAQKSNFAPWNSSLNVKIIILIKERVSKKISQHLKQKFCIST